MISRSTFLKQLFTVGIGSTIPKKLLSYKKVYLLQCFVAGFQHYRDETLVANMQAGDMLGLRREPNNEADRRAIALFYKQQKIGFIPRRENKILSRLIDAEALPLIAEITHIQPNLATWEQLHIAVFMLKEQHGPLAPQAQYLTAVQEPVYKSKPDNGGRKDWYAIIERESKTDHFYDLWYSNGPYPNMPYPTHNGDFIVIRRSRMPAYFRDTYATDIACDYADIEPPYGDRDYMIMKTGRLGNYLEAARSIKEVFDTNGNNYLELSFI